MISSTTWVAARVERKVTPMREKHIFFIVSGGHRQLAVCRRPKRGSLESSYSSYFTWRKHERPVVEQSTRLRRWDDRQERDQGLRIKAKAVASSITGLPHI